MFFMEQRIIVELVKKLIFTFVEKALDSEQHDHEFNPSNFHIMLFKLTFEDYSPHLKKLKKYRLDNRQIFIDK